MNFHGQYHIDAISIVFSYRFVLFYLNLYAIWIIPNGIFLFIFIDSFTRSHKSLLCKCYIFIQIIYSILIWFESKNCLNFTKSYLTIWSDSYCWIILLMFYIIFRCEKKKGKELSVLWLIWIFLIIFVRFPPKKMVDYRKRAFLIKIT